MGREVKHLQFFVCLSFTWRSLAATDTVDNECRESESERERARESERERETARERQREREREDRRTGQRESHLNAVKGLHRPTLNSVHGNEMKSLVRYKFCFALL